MRFVMAQSGESSLSAGDFITLIIGALAGIGNP